jgi:hypothetical protein
MSHNKAPSPSNHELPVGIHDELVVYNDGRSSLRFNSPGNVVQFGDHSKHKYSRSVHSSSRGGDLAIVRTRSGNAYGIGIGIVINAKEQKAYVLPLELPEVKIGEPWQIPGVSDTTNVESVELRYKHGHDLNDGHIQIDKPSPFNGLEAQLEQARQLLIPESY